MNVMHVIKRPKQPVCYMFGYSAGGKEDYVRANDPFANFHFGGILDKINMRSYLDNMPEEWRKTGAEGL